MGCRVFGLLVGLLVVATPLSASDARNDFETQVNRIVVQLNHEAQVDVEGSTRIADLIHREYDTAAGQLKWAVDHSMPWGETVALAYIQHATGRSFERLTQEDARRDFWQYTEKLGMSSDKMAHSLEGFLKTAEKERNSRIFERLRVSRRVQALPDLGSGFGLFQDALDFRRLDPPRPTKVHVVTGRSAKGEL